MPAAESCYDLQSGVDNERSSVQKDENERRSPVCFVRQRHVEGEVSDISEGLKKEMSLGQLRKAEGRIDSSALEALARRQNNDGKSGGLVISNVNREVGPATTRDEESKAGGALERLKPATAVTQGGAMNLPRLDCSSDDTESTELIHVPPAKIARPRHQLPEDTYIDSLSHVIARDYFPGFEDDATVPEPSARSMTLSEFQNKYTSEDNSSFNDLLEKETFAARQRDACVYNNNSLTYRSRQPSSNSDDPRPSIIESWRYQPLNTLMFEHTGTSAQSEKVSKGSIDPESTRLPQAFAQKLHETRGPSLEQAHVSAPTVAGYTYVTPQSFKISNETRDETLHRRLLARKEKSKIESVGNHAIDLSNGRITKTPTSRLTPSQKPMSPAASRLIDQLRSTPRRSH